MNKFLRKILFLLTIIASLFYVNYLINKQEIERIPISNNYYNEITGISLNESIEQSKTLSYEEKVSILNYIDDYFLQINGYLRGELPDISRSLKNDIENIHNALDKSFLPEDTLLYRGVNADFIENVFKDKDISMIIKGYPTYSAKNLKKARAFLIGKTFVEKGFMSTTYSENRLFVRPIILKINAPKGLNALVLDDISGGDEKEILIKNDYQWKITDVFYANIMGKKMTWNIVIELVPN